MDFHEFFKICESNTRQSTFKKLQLPFWKLKFSRNKLSFRAVLSFNLLPNGSWDLTRGQFKRMAKQFILDHKQDFINLTLSFNISGKITSAPSEAVTEKMKELKELNTHKPGLLNLGYIFENAPSRKKNSEKFWIQAPAAGFKGFRGPNFDRQNTNDQTQPTLATQVTQKIPRMLARLLG